MPLRISDTKQLPSLQDVLEGYLIFYSSVTESGELWCPDCRDVDPTVLEIFGPSDGPEALIVYVGQQIEWKRPANNKFRGEPWWIESIPTIIKVRDSKEVGRLVDSQAKKMKDHLASFIGEG